LKTSLYEYHKKEKEMGKSEKNRIEKRIERRRELTNE